MIEPSQPSLQTLQALLNDITPLSAEASQALSTFVFYVQWAATILYQLSGLYDARKYGMDIYGSLVIGLVVSVGGGTIRDLLLGRSPVFWVADPEYAISAVVVGILALLIRRMSRDFRPTGAKAERLAKAASKVPLIIDSLGLGLWAYLGATYALEMGAAPVIALIMGIVTASFGGVLRDVFFARVPQTFMPGQLYVTAAAVGAIVYVLLWWLGVGETGAFAACLVLTFVVRILAVKLDIRSR